MKWLSCIKSIAETHKVGNCPYCSGKNTDYAYVLVDKHNNMGYLDIWCDDCKKLGHISRVKIPNTNKMINVEEANEMIPRYDVT